MATAAATTAAVTAATEAATTAAAGAYAHAVATTRYEHKLSVNSHIAITTYTTSDGQIEEWSFDDLRVFQVKSDTEFVFKWPISKVPPINKIAPGTPEVVVLDWTGSALRCGIFDDQNGMFFEYDGLDLYAVRRTSTKQISGSASVVFNTPVVKGNSYSRFMSQLLVGDRIVIKGQSYKVVNIESDTLLYIQPVYRGLSYDNAIISRTIERRDRRINWDDPCDGTGASGYDLDIHKIQMIYIDYSWYGAGKVRFGVRGTDGSIVYVHTMVHNNFESESYMRSGNVPARYEVQNFGYPSYVPSLLHWGTSVIMDGRYDDDRAYMFTASGKVLSFTGNTSLPTSAIFSSITATDVKLLLNKQFSVYDTSSASMVTAYGIVFPVSNYDTYQNVRSGTVISSVVGSVVVNGTTYNGQTIQFYAPNGTISTSTVTISQPARYNQNWGILYVRDRFAPPDVSGVVVTTTNYTRFNNCSMVIGNIVDATIPSIIPLISIRLAPSVDNSLTGPLGDREVINRMQLTLHDVGLMSTHDCEIRMILNSFPDNKSWKKVTQPSLSQLLYHEVGDAINGGTNIFTFRANGGVPGTGNKRTPVSTTQDLSNLVTLGNSILGGDGIFPDGPDLLTICALPLDLAGISVATPFTITSRVTWTESQA